MKHISAFFVKNHVMKSDYYFMLDGPSKSVVELKSHLRLLNALNPKGVYFRDDTAGAVARLYKKFKRAARRGRNDALFSSVMDKFQSVHYAAVRLCRGERKEKAERAAFEICRHTLMALGDGEILALCADVFGKDLPFLAALRDELEIKKCQLFCLAAWHILFGSETSAEKYLSAILGGEASTELSGALRSAETRSGETSCRIYSGGNFTLSLNGRDVLLDEKKFVMSNGVRFCFAENGVTLGEKFVGADFRKKSFVCVKECGALSFTQKSFFNENGFVCSFSVSNGGQKARKINTLALADFVRTADDAFVQNGVCVLRFSKTWFCAACDVFCQALEDENLRLLAEIRCAAKSEVRFNFCFGVFGTAAQMKRFVHGAGRAGFYRRDFVTDSPAETSVIFGKTPCTSGGLPLSEKLACERRTALSRGSLTAVSGYNTDSFISAAGDVFSVGDRLFTSPRFGGERVFVRVDGKTYLLNSGEISLADDKIVFAKQTAAAKLTLEISHFGVKNYKITLEGVRGRKTVSVILCLDLLGNADFRRRGGDVVIGDYVLTCPPCSDVTSAFDKFRPDFSFGGDVPSGVCAVKCGMTAENMCEINFTLARKMPGDAPGDVFAVDDCAFWNGNAMALSSSLIHAGLKEISLFSLPPVAYTGGRYLKDILAALKKDLAYDVMTVSGVRRAKASAWAYWLGAAWFVCMYPDDEFSAPLSETFGEMLMTKPATAAEKTAKALACLKICRHVKDRAECLTVAEKLKDYAATLTGSDALLAYMCGLTGGKVDGVGSLGGLYRFAREKLPRVDGGFLSVMILENFAGITADGGEILLSPRFDGNIGKIRGRFFGKTMEFDFRKGEPSAALNGGKTSGRISAKGLGDRSFFSVGY